MIKRFTKINIAIITVSLIFFAGTLFGNGAEKHLPPQQGESTEILIFKDGKWQPWDSSYIGFVQDGWRDLNIPVKLDANTQCKTCINEVRECEVEIVQEMEIWNTARETTEVLSAEMELPENANIKDIIEYIYFPYVVDTANWDMLWAKKKNLSKGFIIKGRVVSWRGVVDPRKEIVRIVIIYTIPKLLKSYELYCGNAVFRGKKYGTREKSQWCVEGVRFWIEVFDDSARVKQVTKTPYGDLEQMVSKSYSNRIEQLAREMKKMSIVYYPYPHQISPALMDSIKSGNDIGAMFLSAANILVSICNYPHCEIINIEKSIAIDDSQAKYEGYYITESPIWIKILSESLSAGENLKREIAEYKLFLSYEDSIDYVNAALELAQIWDKTIQKKSLPFFLPDSPKRFWELVRNLYLLDRKREPKLKEEAEKRRKEVWGWYWKQRDLLQIREDLEKAILNAERNNYLTEVDRLRKEAANIESKMNEETKKEWEKIKRTIKVNKVSEYDLNPLVENYEIKERRTRNTKFYNRGNGLITAVVSSASLHYRTQDGLWKDINLNIQKSNRKDFLYACDKNNLRVYFNPHLIKMDLEGTEIELCPKQIQIKNEKQADFLAYNISKGTIEINGNKAIYHYGKDLKIETEITPDVIWYRIIVPREEIKKT